MPPLQPQPSQPDDLADLLKWASVLDDEPAPRATRRASPPTKGPDDLDELLKWASVLDEPETTGDPVLDQITDERRRQMRLIEQAAGIDNPYDTPSVITPSPRHERGVPTGSTRAPSGEVPSTGRPLYAHLQREQVSSMLKAARTSAWEKKPEGVPEDDWDRVHRIYVRARSVVDSDGNIESIRSAAREFHASSPDDKRLFIAAVHDFAKKQGKLKGLKGRKLWINRLAAGFRSVKDGITDLATLAGYDAPEARALARQAEAAYRSGDPVGEEANVISRTFGTALEMVGPMATGLAPGATLGRGGKLAMGASNTLFWTQHLYPGEYDKLLEADVKRRPAIRGALVSSILQAGVESLTINPFYRKVSRVADDTIKSFVGRAVREHGKLYARELSEETLQAAISEGTEAVATRLDKEAPDSDLANIYRQAIQQTVDAAGPLLFLMGPGATVSSVQVALKDRAERIETQEPPVRGAAVETASEQQAAAPTVETKPTEPRQAAGVFTKAEILSEAGARRLFDEDPDLAVAIADKKRPSRKDVKPLRISDGKLLEDDRKQLGELLRAARASRTGQSDIEGLEDVVVEEEAEPAKKPPETDVITLGPSAETVEFLDALGAERAKPLAGKGLYRATYSPPGGAKAVTRDFDTAEEAAAWMEEQEKEQEAPKKAEKPEAERLEPRLRLLELEALVVDETGPEIDAMKAEIKEIRKKLGIEDKAEESTEEVTPGEGAEPEDAITPSRTRKITEGPVEAIVDRFLSGPRKPDQDFKTIASDVRKATELALTNRGKSEGPSVELGSDIEQQSVDRVLNELFGKSESELRDAETISLNPGDIVKLPGSSAAQGRVVSVEGSGHQAKVSVVLLNDYFSQKKGATTTFRQGLFGTATAKKPPPARPAAKEEAKPTAVEEIAAEADEGYEEGAEPLFSGVPMPRWLRPREKDRGPDVVPVFESENPEVNRRVGNKMGIRPESLLKRIGNAIVLHWYRFDRPQEHLAYRSRAVKKRPELAGFNEYFRLLKAKPQAVANDTIRRIAAITDPLAGPNQLTLFTHKLRRENMLHAVQVNQPLRDGYESVEQIERDLARINDLIKQEEAAPIRKALEHRKRIVRELVEKEVKWGVLPKEVLENVDSYFHQQVAMKQAAQKAVQRAGAKETKRSHQHKRYEGPVSLPEEYDYNFPYLESEFEWMAEAAIAIEEAKLKETYIDPVDKAEDFKKQAKSENFSKLVGGDKNVARIESLRADLRASREGPDANESDQKQMRRGMHEQLEALDPTHKSRKKIGWMSAKIRKMLENEEIDAGPLEEGFSDGFRTAQEEEWDEVLYTDQEWFKFIQWLAAAQPNTKAGILARGIFKGNNERNTIIKDALGDDLVTWIDIHRRDPDRKLWQPRPGHMHFPALTIPEQAVEAIQRETLSQITLDTDQLQEVIAIGGAHRQYSLPADFVDQLNQLDKPLPQSKTINLIMRYLKPWLLFKPTTVGPYMARNISGDVDATIGGGALLAIKSVPKAFIDLYRIFRGDIAVPDDVTTTRELGLTTSGYSSIELPELEAAMPNLRRLYSPEGISLARRGAKLVGGYFKAVIKVNELRENILRLAAFRYYKDQLEQGTLKHYGGSRKVTVDELHKEFGADVAAAHLARNVVGDYGNLGVYGSWIRAQALPFWSYMEVNLRRYPMFFANAFAYGKAKSDTKTGQAVYTAMALMGIGAMYAVTSTWNLLVMGDVEDELNRFDRENPHLTLGRHADGAPRVFRNFGALGDLLEWAGLNTLVGLLPYYLKGQITTKRLLTEMAKDPVNKVVQGIGPHFKGVAEILTGHSAFPDVFNITPMDRDDLATGVVGLLDVYKTTKGHIFQTGERARPHFWQRFAYGINDPRRTALNEMYALRKNFLEVKGLPPDSPPGRSRVRIMRTAAQDENFEAFRQARNRFIEKGGEWKNVKNSMKGQDPIKRLNDELEREFEEEFISPHQHEKLKKARDFIHETGVTMYLYWQAAARMDDTPEQQAELKVEINKQIVTRARVLAQKLPKTREGRREWVQKRREAVEWFREREIKPGTIRRYYNGWLRRNVKDRGAREDHADRLQRGLRRFRRAS